MKYPVTIILLIAAFAASCHKPKHNAVTRNTTAQPNIADSVDSAAVAAHYKVDEYPGTLVDKSDYNGSTETKMSFFVVHITDKMLVLKSDRPVQINDVQWGQTFDNRIMVCDTIYFTGPGSYGLQHVYCTIGSGALGDTLHLYWKYSNNSHPEDADENCNFVAARTK